MLTPTQAKSKTIRRDWLLKQVDAGRIEAKCEMHLTDDYAWDNANGFGIMKEWKPARIRRPRFEPRMMPGGFERDVCVDDDSRDGFVNFMEFEFTSMKTGHAHWQDDARTLIHFSVHSNLWYTLRIKPEVRP